MELLDRQPSENARSYALRVLLHNIITLELAPGSAVSENELSQILKLSRTPVREALIELSKMGLVDIQPQRGSYIAKIDYEEMLRANMEEETRHLEAGDYTRLFELDTDFHRLLFTSVGKARTYGIIHSQMVHFDRLRALSLKSLKPDKIVEDHENILYAIGRRDSELAEMLMTRHLTRHRVEKSELIKLYPDYFV